MKPTVFNYQEYERVVEENKKLNAEVANLRIRIADGDKRDCKSCKHQKADGCSRWNCEYEPRMDGLISRQDAIEAVATVTMSIHLSNVLCDKLLALPSADRPTTDCTKFLEWLKAEVLDEENWELNAVANGEIICRKFKKMGWLDVEDGYYVETRPTVDKEYLIDLIQEAVYDGEACAKLIDLVDRPTGEWVKALDGCERHVKCTHCFKTYDWHSEAKHYNYCPNCGAKMER